MIVKAASSGRNSSCQSDARIRMFCACRRRLGRQHYKSLMRP
jgi:hypothetical protein